MKSRSFLCQLVRSSFSLLSVFGDYRCKGFCFLGNWVGRKVVRMKTTFFAIFDPTWTHNLTPKGTNKEFSKQYFNFQLIRKTEVISLSILKVKFLKKFAIFDQNQAKNLAQASFICGISSYICLKFPLRCLYKHYVLLQNIFPIENMKKSY